MAHAVSTTDDGTRVITLRGHIADAEAAQVRASLVDALWRDRAARVRVEICTGVAIDSTLFGALVAAEAVASDQDATIEFRCDDRTIRDQLAAFGLRAA